LVYKLIRLQEIEGGFLFLKLKIIVDLPAVQDLKRMKHVFRIFAPEYKEPGFIKANVLACLVKRIDPEAIPPVQSVEKPF